MAALREVPFGLYYGSVDSTPLFVLLAGLYLERTGDVRNHRRTVAGDRSRAGLDRRPGRSRWRRLCRISCARPSRVSPIRAGRIRNDAIFHADGRLAEGAIALAEVQGYVYAAKRMAARCARRLGRRRRGRQARCRSRQRLPSDSRRAFWCPEIETYALALDGAKKPCAVRTSNAGQVLVQRHRRSDARRAGRRRACCGPTSSPAGASARWRAAKPRYNPMSYHNGSIWPHDNALIALGFARYGLKRPIETVVRGLVPAPRTYMDHRRLPELFCGFQRQHGHGPTLYPVACAPQAWASADAVHASAKLASGSNLIRSPTRSGCAIRGCRHFSTR